MKIKVFITGGTIDNLEYDSEDKAPKGQESLIPDLLEQARLSVEHSSEVVIFKDSKFVNDDDRAALLKRCQETPENHIVITHGTMTMPETAKYIGEKLKDKTIVLLGAAIPANKEKSDAFFNLGAAFLSVQLLPKGVYVLMNGKVFPWDNVKKNFESGYFEEEK